MHAELVLQSEDVAAVAYDVNAAETVIRHLTWGGFHEPTEILETLFEETFDPDTLTREDRAALFARVTAVFRDKAEAELSWPAQVDWDMLDAAFDAMMETHAILGLHASGTTQSDMWEDALEIAASMKQDGFPMRAACFYHYQDVARAVDDGALNLTFGPLGQPRGLTAVAVGRLVVQTLEAFDFKPVWDGTEASRIALPIDWKKRFEPDDDEEDDDDADD